MRPAAAATEARGGRVEAANALDSAGALPAGARRTPALTGAGAAFNHRVLDAIGRFATGPRRDDMLLLTASVTGDTAPEPRRRGAEQRP